MRLQIINPISYPDWDALLVRNNDHSFFHSSAWARVLAATYGFKPLYFVDIKQSQLAVLMPFMETHNILAVKRGVSLPFTDQCVPYAPNKESLKGAIEEAFEYGLKNKWSYTEWRDGSYFPEVISPWEKYYIHDIDLTKTEAKLFADLRGNNRRNIKKAGREGVIIKIDQSFESVKKFYRLNLMTRRRHGFPAQPFAFFNNVLEHIISKGYGIVVSAYHAETMIASSIFFNFGQSAIYKYSASKPEYHFLRPNNLIMWEAIKWYKRQGITTLSLARTEFQNQGLLRYKRAWGARESVLKYYRYDIGRKSYLQKRPGNTDLYRDLFARTPTSILRIIAHFFYRYVG